MPRGRSRTAVALVALGLLLGVGGYFLYQSRIVHRWFARDAENPEELARLGGAKLEVAPPAAPSAGWPQWRGPLRDGRASAGPLRTDWATNPPKQLWRAECGGGYSSFAVVGGKVYTQDRKEGGERVLCLDAETGSQVWAHAYPADYAKMDRTYATGPRATPTVEGNRVYTVGATGKLLCLEAPEAAGSPPRVVWEHDLPGEFRASIPQWGIACSPLIDGDQVVVIPGGKDGAVAAFDKATGNLRWKVGANPAGYSSPVAATIHGVRVVFAFTGDSLLAVRGDGKLMGSYRWPTRFEGNIATPIVVDDYVFIASAYGQGCALLRVVPNGDEVKLEEAYARRRPALFKTHHSTAVYRDGFLYGFDGDSVAQLKCLDFRHGTERDGWDASGLKKGTLILADRHLVILTEQGELALVEATPEEFRLVAKVASGLEGSNLWALPVLVDGRLYLRDGEKVLCLDIRP